MTVSILQVARTIGGASGWTLSNLELQKMAYMAEMIHLGRNGGAPLVFENFEAWERGPVCPTLYHEAKAFGSKPVKDIFRVPSLDFESPEHNSAIEGYQLLSGKTAGQMVRITHWANGAWAKMYRPGVRGIAIPKSLILEEYRARTVGA